MSFSIAANFIDANADALAALRSMMTDREIAANVAQEELNMFRMHFVANGTNKHNWPSTAFWTRAARSLSWSEAMGGVSINIAQIGVRQRYQGGEIFPIGDHVHLSIPARAEAYGHLPREFTNLRPLFHRVDGRVEAFALVEADLAQNKSRRGQAGSKSSSDTFGGGVYYWLVRKVYQQPDPYVIPSDWEIALAAKEALDDLLEQVKKGGKW